MPFRLRGLYAALLGSAFLCLATCVANAQATQPAPTAPLSATDKTVLFFYQDPKPERLVELVADLQRLSPDWNAYPPVAGLLSIAFTQHPDWIDRIVPATPDAKMASTLTAALRLAGQPGKAAQLQSKFAGDGQLNVEFSGLPTRLDDLQIVTPTHLDIVWGASFADGDARHVRAIIDFMAATANTSDVVAIDIAKTAIGIGGGPKDTLLGLKARYGDATATRMIYAGVALWAIRTNAFEHPYVKEAVNRYLRDNPGTPTGKALAVAIADIK